jgi:bifunctional DNA-binding transcriptional regulator/antitoxin component of YhaV-PrlF toxin-antitoxin module
MAAKRKHGSKDETVRKITKTGKYTYYVTIPKSYIDELGWRERQRVVVELEDDRLVVRDYRP